eukprot:TRINITY_DN963_c0_g1_i1.p2 TRINITY_DN963_c0_g1~~TRINITY_DN963_c0_g1_i1.p2  ORF type:complete len:348 (+),score=144.41 TRINITY_DN963_c0_g1_i1:54-1097(+)
MTAQSKMSAPVATSMFSWSRVKTALWGTDVEETSPNLYQYLRNWVKHGVPKPRNDEEVLQYKWLLYFFAGCSAWYAASPDTAMKLFNPWNLSVPSWLFWFSAKQWSLENYNDFVMYILRNFGFKKLPTGPIPGVADEMDLEPIDFFYLRVNAVIDMVFLSVMTYLVAKTATPNFALPRESLVGPAVTKALNTTGGYVAYQTLRTLLSCPLLVLVSDGSYAFLHWGMHRFRTLYHAVHRHHHRIVRPQGGLVDVRNYHPIELVLSSSVFLLALAAANMTVGMTPLSALVAFSGQVAANVCNHSGYDVTFLTFSAGDHEMHHRVPTVNMGIASYFVDKYILRSYKPYTP